MKKVRVWDLPTRLFHWILLALIVAAYTSRELDAMVWHQRIGLAILGLIVFRLTWGFVGSTHARFTDFLRGPAAIRAYLRGEWRGLGHNPLGGWSVLALLLAPLGMALTGLFANDAVAFRGMLADRVSRSVSTQLTDLHVLLFNALLVLVALHVAAILYHRLAKKEDLVRPMLDGVKTVGEDAADAQGGGWSAVLFALTLAGASVALVFWLAPAPVSLPADYSKPDW